MTCSPSVWTYPRTPVQACRGWLAARATALREAVDDAAEALRGRASLWPAEFAGAEADGWISVYSSFRTQEGATDLEPSFEVEHRGDLSAGAVADCVRSLLAVARAEICSAGGGQTSPEGQVPRAPTAAPEEEAGAAGAPGAELTPTAAGALKTETRTLLEWTEALKARLQREQRCQRFFAILRQIRRTQNEVLRVEAEPRPAAASRRLRRRSRIRDGFLDALDSSAMFYWLSVGLCLFLAMYFVLVFSSPYLALLIAAAAGGGVFVLFRVSKRCRKAEPRRPLLAHVLLSELSSSMYRKSELGLALKPTGFGPWLELAFNSAGAPVQFRMELERASARGGPSRVREHIYMRRALSSSVGEPARAALEAALEGQALRMRELTLAGGRLDLHVCTPWQQGLPSGLKSVDGLAPPDAEVQCLIDPEVAKRCLRAALDFGTD